MFSGFSIASVVGVPVGTWVANAFGWRWAFHLVNALTVVLIIGMVAVLPRNSHAAKIGFLSQFRLFFDRRIQLGVLDVVCGAAASYVFYTYLTPIMRDEVHVPEQYLSVGLVIFGAACLWSNLYGGKLADRGRGVEPLTTSVRSTARTRCSWHRSSWRIGWRCWRLRCVRRWLCSPV